jgi:hypothetical protein
MQRTFLKVFAIALLLELAAYGQQSLGDIARQLREKQAAEEAAGTAPKMYTNQDIPPADQVGTPEPAEAQPEQRARAMGRMPDDRSLEHRFADQRAAREWKRDLVMQENRVAGLQMRIDRLNAMIHSPYGTAQYEGPYNRNQARAQHALEQMQRQLGEQQMRLDEMQDAARHAGVQGSENNQ